MSDETQGATLAALVSAAMGSGARVALVLMGGERRSVVLAIHGFVGAVLGVVVCAGAVYFDPGLRGVGWSTFILAGTAGLAGAMGTKLLDDLAEFARRRLLGL